MIWLTKDQIILLHRDLAKATGGAVELRDDGLLDSAVMMPMQTFGSIELYSSIVDKAVRLAWGLTKNHPFVDGNKRIGVHAMLVTLYLNGVYLKYTQEELSSTILKLAAGETEYEQLLEWVVTHIINEN